MYTSRSTPREGGWDKRKPFWVLSQNGTSSLPFCMHTIDTLPGITATVEATAYELAVALTVAAKRCYTCPGLISRDK